MIDWAGLRGVGDEPQVLALAPDGWVGKGTPEQEERVLGQGELTCTWVGLRSLQCRPGLTGLERAAGQGRE